MFHQLLKVIFGTKNDRDLSMLKPIVQKINQLEAVMQQMSDETLKQQTDKLKKQLALGSTLDDILPEAFATVREASKRVLGMRHFDAQLMGGIILHKGIIAEMKTGEGKTLTATLPLYLNALAGKGAHLVTVNDYLAKRDGTEMGVLYQWLGMSVGIIVHDLEDEERQKAYGSDITYGTNNEFAFDYLRDNMKFDLSQYVQREHFFCIVDEVDSILIDEARTPLIISGPAEGDVELYYDIDKQISKLEKTVHYEIDEKHHTAILTDAGVVKLQELLKIKNLYDPQHIETVHHINQSIKAHGLFHRDINYVVKEGQVIIVDEFTGRLKTGSRWSDGLHQAVEAKEGVKIKKENQTLASITFQNFFRLYKKLSGMTGTADTEAEEFKKIYNLDVVVIPTNLPMIRIDEPDIIYTTKQAKYLAAVKLIKDCHERGQPVLVGTISIESSEIISNLLLKEKIPHEVLNAKQHEREAHIVAHAGSKGAVTIATNMAGRGTDIKLTPETVAAGGLFILGTERHESRRIDNQLRGRSGRQGDPGRSKFFLSLEDDLMRIFGSDRIKKMMISMGMKDDEPIEHKMISNAIAKAQKKVEAHNFDIRKHLLDYDNVMNEQRQTIYRLRKEILNDQDNRQLVDQFIEDMVLNIVHEYVPNLRSSPTEWDFNSINNGVASIFHLDEKLNADICMKEFNSDLEAYLHKKTTQFIEQKFAQYDEHQVKMTIREVLLSTFDAMWKDHLFAMDHLKDGIGLRSYGQKDPLVEYKRDGFQLFEQMRSRIKQSVVETLFTIRLYTQAEIEEIKRKQEQMLEAQMNAHRQQLEADQKQREQMMKQTKMMQQQQQQQKSLGPAKLQNSANEELGPVRSSPIVRATVKVGRNDPCPCGSGKKFKQCHGVDR